MDRSSIAGLVKHRQRLRELSKYYCDIHPDATELSRSRSRPISLAQDDQLTALAQLAALRLDCRHAFVSLIDHQHHHIIAEASRSISPFDILDHDPQDGIVLGVRSIPLDLTADFTNLQAFSTDAKINFEVPGNQADPTHIVIADLKLESRTRDWPILASLPVLGYYLEVPLRSPTGYLLGCVCVVDNRPRTPREKDTLVLRGIAKLILAHLDRVRLEKDHKRVERLLEGLSHFNQGRDSISDWSKATPGQDHIPAVHPDTTPLSSSTLHSRARGSETEQRDSKNLRSQASPSVIERKTGDTTLLSLSISNETQIHQPNRGLSPGSSTGPSMQTSADQAATTSTEPTMTSEQAPETTTSLPDSVVETSFDPVSLEINNNETEVSTLASTAVRSAFARASNLIREAMDLDTVCFLEIPHNERYTRLSRPTQSKNSSQESLRTLDSDASTDSSLDLSSRESSMTNVNNPSVADEVLCHRLGFSTRAKSSLAASRTASNYLTIPAKLLTTLTAKYPSGRIFNFLQPDNLSSSDETEADRILTKNARKKSLASQIYALFPDARSMFFLPLYDNDKQQVYAGLLGWTKSNARALQTYELLYVTGFIHSIMCEVMRLDAIATNQAKSNFISSMSHELRSPLHGILASYQLLSEMPHVEPQQDEYIQMIGTCASTLLDIMNHLLEHAKINHFTQQQSRSKKSRPQLKGPQNSYSLVSTTNLLSLVEETVTSMTATSNPVLATPIAPPDGVLTFKDLQQKMENSLPPIILNIESRDNWNYTAEAGSWRRIIMNILGNSIKYTQRGHILVNFSVQRLDKDRETFDHVGVLTVTDTGRGISDEYLKHRLFTPFAQESNLSVGAGLGLSLVKQMVSSLGGSIDIQSKIDVGTEVTVRIPLRSSAEQFHGQMQLDMSMSTAQAYSQGSTFKFWGFDDQPAMRDETSTGIPDDFTQASIVLCKSMSMTLIDWFAMQPASESQANVHIVEERFLKANLNAFDRGDNDLIVIGSIGRNKVVPLIRLANVQYVSPPIGPVRMASILQALYRSRSLPPPKELPDETTAREPPASETSNEEPVSNASKNVGSSSSRPPGMGTLSYTPKIIDPSIPAGLAHNKEFVLLVDDNDINLRILVATIARLKRESVHYLTAVNGQDAVDQFARVLESGSCVSLCFMDISMPVMDGIEATRRIRALEKSKKVQRGKRCTVIALTGLASEEAQHEIETSGFDIYLTKPVNLKVVRELLGTEDQHAKKSIT